MMDPIAEKHIFMLVTIAYHNKFEDEPCKIKDLIEKLNSTQQTVSRHLIELEKAQFIKRTVDRKNQVIHLTDKAMNILRAHYEKMYMIFSDLTNGSLDFVGTVNSGLGEGAFYVKIPQYLIQFKSLLGAEPYHGTLNVFLSDENNQIDRFYNVIKNLIAKRINGFTTNERSYGAVECFEAYLANHENPDRKERCFILNIHRTSHKYGTLELISDKYLRGVLGLQDNSKVIITLVK